MKFRHFFPLLFVALLFLNCTRPTDYVYDQPRPEAPPAGKPSANVPPDLRQPAPTPPPAPTAAPGPRIGALSGKVTDVDSGQPISGANITVRTSDGLLLLNLTSDAQGNYAIAALAAGTYSLDATKSGYDPESVRAITYANTNEVKNIQMAKQGGFITGRVTNAIDGRALQGVTVSLHRGGGDTPTDRLAATDYDGRYSFPGLTPGEYSLDFRLNGYIPILARPATVRNGETRVDVTMTNVLEEGQFRAILRWNDVTGGGVRDVDSYLKTPDQQIPIHFSNKDNRAGAKLDVDDIDWSGPETVTIYEQHPGTYIYYVDNYSDRFLGATKLGKSGVTVELYRGAELVKKYVVPPGEGYVYEVFQIIDGRVVNIERYNDNLWTVHDRGF